MPGVDSCIHGVRGRREDRLNRITDGLEIDAAVGFEDRIEQANVTPDSSGHRLAVPLPERGAAFDVGDEQGDGTAGEIGHDPLQTLGGTWCWPIVAREYCAHARGSPMH